MKYCSVDGCESQLRGARGLCNKHYKQYRATGIPKPTQPSKRQGIRRIPEYNTWAHFIQRCTNPRNRRYADWGGRGIKVCKRYRHSFIAFYDDLGSRPDGMQLDRKDNNGNYSCGRCEECLSNGWPMNLRWTTFSRQQINKRIRVDNTSGYKDITWNKRHQYWGVVIQRNKKVIFAGWFDELADAIEARDEVLVGHTYPHGHVDKRRQRPEMNGDHNPSAKLTWGKVHQIRELWLRGGYYQREIGAMFGVNQAIVSRIILNASWHDADYASKVVKRHKWQTKQTKDNLAA